MRRELYATGSVINASVAAAQAAEAGPSSNVTAAPETRQTSDLQRPADPAVQFAEYPYSPHSAKVSSTILPNSHSVASVTENPLPFGPVDEALDKASAALSTTLSKLSLTLTNCTREARQNTASAAAQTVSEGSAPFVDIKLHTEAMKDVLTVLEQVGRMERAREMRRRAPGPRGGPILLRAAAEGEEGQA
jgi:hypothetical protein